MINYSVNSEMKYLNVWNQKKNVNDESLKIQLLKYLGIKCDKFPMNFSFSFSLHPIQ